MVKERNIALCIVFSIITCGIYGLYWFVCLTDEINQISGEEGASGVLALVLTIITCGIYGLYWAYKNGEKLDIAHQKNGGASSGSNGILYLILCVLGLGIVAYALMQNELNKFA